MKYPRGKNPAQHKKMVSTQLASKHPWRKPFYFTTRGTSYAQKRVVE